MSNQFPSSPRIQKLQNDFEAGQASALDIFWQEVREQGTPLVEEVKGIDQHVLATFLWQAERDTMTVFIFGGMAQPDQMTKLPNTNLWFKSYHLPRDACFTYELGPSKQMTPSTTQQWDADLADWQPDPLNPRSHTYPHDEEGAFYGYTASLVELAHAPRQLWAKTRREVASGNVQFHRFQSKLLQNERRLWVYTPPTIFVTSEPYGLLLLFDGFIYNHVIPTSTILDNLLSQKRIHPTVAVMVDSPDRIGELSANPRFVDFLIEELIPWVRERFPVTRDPLRTIIGGSSAGGLAATYAAVERPDIFRNVISQSGAFWLGNQEQPDWFVEKVATLPKLPLRLYLDVGIYEPQNLALNRKMRDILDEKGYDFHYVEYSAAHEPLSWQGGLPEALLTLM